MKFGSTDQACVMLLNIGNYTMDVLTIIYYEQLWDIVCLQTLENIFH